MTRPVREIEHLFIPLADGTRLAARIWLPEDAEQRPVPAILEYLPYRLRDGTVERDRPVHSYLAARGYAAVRVDIRGSGNSDGLLEDEYLALEQDDALEVIAWLAAQPWCDGVVGMMGISWGGFNGLQIAARRPPALKAVLTLCSTDDRYADDIHYMGGALLIENLGWGSVMQAFQTRPPNPEIRPDWREVWLHRLERTPDLTAEWLRHQTRDAYWRHGSVIEDYAAIAVPVFAIGGWTDGYTNAVGRLLDGLRAQAIGLIGPWGHRLPHIAHPGPRIGFLQESLRFWDQTLKGIDTGILQGPKLRAFIQDDAPPRAFHAARPGRWVAEPAWPGEGVAPLRLFLAACGRLADRPEEEDAVAAVVSPQTVGAAAGTWSPWGHLPDYPLDQRADDAGSLVYEGAPLDAPLDLLGTPVLRLRLAIDQPQGFVVARLSAVAPDGAAARLSYGVFNLTHRHGRDRVAPVAPGETFEVALKLNDLGQQVPAGHRLRLSLSTAYWPQIWPSPAPVRLSVGTAGSSLSLPVRPRRAEAAPDVVPEPEAGEIEPRTELTPPSLVRVLVRDLATGIERIEHTTDEGRWRLDRLGLELASRAEERFTIHPDDPLTASHEVEHRKVLARGDWRVETRTRFRQTASATHFVLEAEIEARHADATVFHRRWTSSIARNGV